jgi:hypothetical protein
MRLASLGIVAGLGFGLAASPAMALTIDFAQISGDTLTTQQADAFNVAAQAWEAVLTNPVTITVDIGFTSPSNLGGSGTDALSAAVPEEYSIGYPSLKTTLVDTATSAAQISSVQNLPNTVVNNNVVGTAADMLALGYSVSSLAGTIQFSNTVNFQYSRNSDGSIDSGYYDFIGIAEHEIGHILGFISDVDSGLNYETVLDLDRYTAPGTPTFTYAAVGPTPSYFSVDGGVTDVAAFSTGNPNQASHWLAGTGLLMQPTIAAGATQNITAIDLEAMNVIGWDLAVPEPGSVALLGTALAGLLAMRRRAVRPAPARA